jgi:hypothetical protein
MKKTVRILAILMVIAMLSIILISCSQSLTGKYSNNIAGIETTYEFGLFGKVTRTTFIPGVISDGETIVKEGKYEIIKNDDNSFEITLEFDDEGSETHSFSKGEENGEKYIKIGIWEYKKVK